MDGPGSSDGVGGRLRRELGTLESYAALIGILVGAGIFRVTGDASALTGASVVLGYVLLAPVVLATAVPYAAFAATPIGSGPGGDYAHVRAVFRGSTVPFVAAWLKLVSYLGAAAFLARVSADYSFQLAVVVGLLDRPPDDSRALATGFVLLFAGIHAFGVRWFGRAQVWMCALLGLAVVVLVVPGLFAVSLDNYRPFFAHGAVGFVQSLAPLFFAYAGFEALAHTAGEVHESTERLPRVFVRGILATSLIFVSMSAVAFGVVGAEGVERSEAPMAEAAARFLPVGGAALVALGGVLAATTSLNATLIVPVRLGLRLADDGYLGWWFGGVHAGTGVPVTGLCASVVIVLVFLWSGTLGLALNIAVLALLSVYWIHGLAFLRLPRADPAALAAAESRLRVRWPVMRLLTRFSLATLSILIASLVSHDLGTILGADPGRWARQGPTSIELFAGWTALGLLLLHRARSRSE